MLLLLLPICNTFFLPACRCRLLLPSLLYYCSCCHSWYCVRFMILLGNLNNIHIQTFCIKLSLCVCVWVCVSVIFLPFINDRFYEKKYYTNELSHISHSCEKESIAVYGRERERKRKLDADSSCVSHTRCGQLEFFSISLSLAHTHTNTLQCTWYCMFVWEKKREKKTINFETDKKNCCGKCCAYLNF